nr:outer membrane lipoprotein carrier protein LolA [Neptunitalea sp. Y10]
MKKFAITALMVCIGINSLVAQSSSKAKTLLDEVYTKVKSYNNLYIDFKFELDNKTEGIHQETKGNVTIDGDKYVLNYLGATKIFDGHKIYTIIPDNEEVTIENKGADDEGTITPSKMLTFYKDGYNYKWKESKNIKGREIQFIELVPISANAEVTNLLLGIDTQTKHIYSLVENGKNGTATTITVNTMKTNQPLPKNTFVFNKDKYKKLGYYISE